MRRVKNAVQLGRALAKLQEAGIDHALVIAGDLAKPVSGYHNSMQILETGLLSQQSAQ